MVGSGALRCSITLFRLGRFTRQSEQRSQTAKSVRPENNTLCVYVKAALAQFPYIPHSVYGRRAFA